MSYWWACNSRVVEQNKVRKSWWNVINNFVNAFTACQLNILFMQHWFQHILCHHVGVGGDFFHLIWRNLVSNNCFWPLRWLALLSQNIITSFTRMIKFLISEHPPLFFCLTIEFSRIYLNLTVYVSIGYVCGVCVCVYVCVCRSWKPVQDYQFIFYTGKTILLTTSSYHCYSI